MVLYPYRLPPYFLAETRHPQDVGVLMGTTDPHF